MSNNSRRRISRGHPIKNRGFSLIEVLVSILILTIGVLGMVGMQAASLQANREARLQSAGVFFAREIADMIRGNNVVAADATNGNPYLGSFTGTSLAPATTSYCLNVATGTVACASNVAVANAQMTDWLSRISSELPGVRVDICREANPFNANGMPVWSATCPLTGSDPIVIKIGWTRGSTDKSATGGATLIRATAPSVVLPVTSGA
jgi:type IV pilus assembly protein PilV